MSRLLDAMRARSNAVVEPIRRENARKAAEEAARKAAKKPVVIFMRLHVPMGYHPKRDSGQKAVALHSN